MSELTITPQPGDDTVAWALHYADLGWHVFPVKGATAAGDPMGPKEPAPEIGRWSQASTTDPQQIVAWFAGTGYGIGVDCGKSGLLVLDGDRPDEMAEWVGRQHLGGAWAMRGNPARTSWVFTHDGTIRCPKRGVRGGEIRGAGGYVVLPPSYHPVGGRYEWLRQPGVQPPRLPAEVAELLPAVGEEHADQATTREVDAAYRGWVGTDAPHTLTFCLEHLRDGLAGGSRHEAALDAAAWAADDARAGFYPLAQALAQIEDRFREAVCAPGPSRRPWDADEWRRIVRWAIGKAQAKPDAEVQARRDRIVGDPVGNDRGWIDWGAFWREETTEPDYLIPRLVPEGAQCALYSPGGHGKSLLMLEWAVNLAIGGSILGTPVAPVDVLYIDLEQDRMLVRSRLEAMGVDAAVDLGRLHYSLLGDWPPLDTPAGGQAVLEETRRLGARLVVIDTTSRVVQGEENTADTFLNLYRHTHRALKREGVAVIRLDHSGKDAERGQRGSSAKSTDVDQVYRLAATGSDLLMLKREKNRLNLDSDEILTLRRGTSPLRHTLATVDSKHEAVIVEIVAALDKLGLDPNAGRDKARTALKTAGLRTYRNDLISEALHRRRGPFAPPARPPFPPLGGGQVGTGRGDGPGDRWGQVGDRSGTETTCPGDSVGDRSENTHRGQVGDRSK